jgi:SAM-dependent methyltransferase
VRAARNSVTFFATRERHVNTNQVNIDHWNSPLTRRWVNEQPRLDHVYGQLDDVAIPRAAPRPGERAIDIGCGCGASTLRIAELVGSSGSVLGIDVSRMMLARARERAAALPQVRLCEADATEHAFARDADLIYSRLGVMFFAEPEAAFANLHEAFAPGGRLCVVCWRGPDANPWYSVPLRAAAPWIAPPAPPPPGAGGPFSLADAERLRAVLQAGGFTQIVLEPTEIALRISSEGLEDAVQFMLIAGPLARLSADQQIGPDAALRVRDAVRAALAPYVAGTSVAMAASFWVASARV